MWNNRRSFLLLVNVKQRKKFGLVIPLSLPVLEVTLDSLRDSLEVWESVFPKLFAKVLSKRSEKADKKLRLSQLFTWCIFLLNELRQYSAFELVHVDDGKNLVSIRLW
jgi:hypothetical protein